MKVLKVYRELRDVAIFEKDNGTIGIRAMNEDSGTEEDQELIITRLFGSEFKSNNVTKLKSSLYKEPEEIKEKDNAESAQS